MSLYDEKNMSAALLTRAFSNLEHLDTHLGRAIREFNSPIGLPGQSWRHLLEYNVPCKGCQCVFSIHGYNSHIVKGLCSMAAPMREGTYFVSSYLHSIR